MKKNYLFLGFAIPDKEMNKVFKEDGYPAIQTHNFNWNLIKGLEEQEVYDFTYISSKPVSDYPVYPSKKIKKQKWNIYLKNKKIKITSIYFLNTSIMKIVTRLIFSAIQSLKEYHRVTNKDGVIVYSVHVPFMITGYLISKLYNIQFIGIWTDPPSVSHNRESFLKKSMRKIELNVSKILMRKVSKSIVLTKFLAEDFAPNKPYLIVEGIINPDHINSCLNVSPKEKNDQIKIVYTGSLEKKYGIENIVKGFQEANLENATLLIYGRGDYENELMKISRDNKAINYKGFITHQEILKVQREADYLINARSAKESFVKYSFPSKTLEYMLSGTPLITTMLPGIPEEYREYFIVLENNQPQTISETLKKLKKQSNTDRQKIGAKALEFAKTKNYKNQGKRIIEFL